PLWCRNSPRANQMTSATETLDVRLELPDLKGPTGIQPANILALQPIWVSAQLESLKVFSVVDRLVQLAQNGTLPIGNSPAGRKLSDYWKGGNSRMSPAERRNLYVRAFGFKGGDGQSPNPNREFEDLWTRFISAV